MNNSRWFTRAALLAALFLVAACSPRLEEAQRERDYALAKLEQVQAQTGEFSTQQLDKMDEADAAIKAFNLEMDLADQAFLQDVMTVGAGGIFVIMAFAAMSGSIAFVMIQIRQRQSRDFRRVASAHQVNASEVPPGDGWKWVN